MTLLRVTYTEDENGERVPVFCFVLVLEDKGIEIVYNADPLETLE